MPGFAAAKPGTGQTVRAIIAPASCRHDNCNAHCLIIVRLSDHASSPAPAGSTPPGLYIAPLRPLPAGSPAGSALHNKTLCKLARANDEPHAANAATALIRHTARVLSRCQPLRQLHRLHTCHLPESPSGFRRSPQCPAAPARSLLLSFIVILPTSSASLSQPPRQLDIGAVCQTVLKELYKMAQSLPPAPRGLQISNIPLLLLAFCLIWYILVKKCCKI